MSSIRRQATTHSLYEKIRTCDASISSQKKLVFGKDVFHALPPLHIPPPEAPFLLEFDSNVALWLISGARLAYLSPGEAEQVAKGIWEMKEFEFFDVQSTDTQAFAAANDDFILVCFRGTESKKDWETNNDFTLVPLNSRPCFESVRVHRGFNTALLSALPLIERFVMGPGGKRSDPAKPLFISGHSLGGALTTLCYAHWSLREQPISVNAVVTVGQPRAGTREFVQAMNEYAPCMLQRIFNTNDVVPTVPLTTLGFRHYGSPIYFDRDGRLVRRPSGSKTKIDKAKSWASGSGGVAAHSCRLYYDLVIAYHDKQAMEQANSAVYKAVFTVHSGLYLRGASPVDAQVVLRYGDATHKTPAVASTTSPVWEHVITFPQVYEFKQVDVEAWDTKSGRFLGSVTVYLDDFTDVDHGQFLLQPRPGNSDNEVKGSLTLSCNYFLISEGFIRESANLALTVHGARNLFESSHAMQPEVRIVTSTGLCKRSPALASSTLNPDWNFSCRIPTVQMGERISLEVWSKETFLGQAVLEIQGSFEDSDYATFDLESRRSKADRVSGKILFSAKFTPLSIQGHQIAKARITIHSAAGLKAADRGGTSDAFVQLHVGEASSKPLFQTPVVKKSVDPIWDSVLDIDRLVAGTPLCFVVSSRARLGRDEFLGQVVLRFSRLTDISSESFSLSSRADKNDKGIKGDLILSFKFEAVQQQK